MGKDTGSCNTLQSTKAELHHNRTICCRKCEENGLQGPRNGLVAPRCPFKNCLCETCADAMSLRVNSIIRRLRRKKSRNYRLVLKPVDLRNGNTRFRIFPEYIVGRERVARPTVINRKRSAKDSRSELPAQNIIEVANEHYTIVDATPQHVSGITAPSIASITAKQDNPQPPCNTNNTWTLANLNAALTSLLATPSAHPVSQLAAVHQPSVAFPNMHTDQAEPFPNTPSTFNPLHIDCPSADHHQNVSDAATSAVSGRLLTVPIIFVEKFSRNFYLSPTVDRFHPMFNHFLNAVRVLEETLLSPTTSNDHF